MPRKKATTNATADAAPPKKRRGRPPKAAAAKKTEQPAKKPAKKAVSQTDGRLVPVSPATTRAANAAERAVANLKQEREALATAQAASADARDKARESGAKGDKTAAQKARAKVQRTSERLAKARTAARAAKARVVELKARDLLDARLNHVTTQLAQAEAVAQERIKTKLERAVGKFQSSERAKLEQAERRKAKQRKQVADQRIATLHSEYEERVQAAQDSLQPKPRKQRKRRAKRETAA